MKQKNEKLATKDFGLFRSQYEDIQRIKCDKVFLKPNIPEKIDIRKTCGSNDAIELHDEFCVVSANEPIFFSRPGLQTKTIRQMRRGELPIQATLDLHRLTIPEAKTALVNFMAKCQNRNLRHLLVIHGKGLHSAENQATLKSAVNSWLRQYGSVLAFCSAIPADGGAGAVYVLLKKTGT